MGYWLDICLDRGVNPPRRDREYGVGLFDKWPRLFVACSVVILGDEYRAGGCRLGWYIV